jgi:hypothetical protein
MTDWAYVRSMKFSTDRPADWPEDVYAISMKGSGLFGIHKRQAGSIGTARK